MFAYGQTGSGKTHTMEGKHDDSELKGMMPRSFTHVFDAIASADKATVNHLVRASMLEIYEEEVYDLLNKAQRKKLELRESPDSGIALSFSWLPSFLSSLCGMTLFFRWTNNTGFYVKDLTYFVVRSDTDCLKVLSLGSKSRTTGATLMNPGSSRSHSIFTLCLGRSHAFPFLRQLVSCCSAVCSSLLFQKPL